MNETKYAVGVDIGTDTAKVIIGHSDPESSEKKITIVGVGVAKNGGMRKGTIVNLDKTAEAVDKALGAAEQMSGYTVDRATVSINGSHIVGLSSKGVIAVSGGSIGHEELARIEEAATVVQLPANREILDVTPRSYKLDAQDGIRDPFGMTGVRLEVDAYMITALTPHIKNLEKVLSMVELSSQQVVLSGLAAARTILSDEQRENGVVAIDIGASTTNMAVFEEGDVIHVAVLPIGSNNITNDLAIGLRTDLDIAEKIKIEYAVAAPELRRGSSEKVSVKIGKGDQARELLFDTATVDEIVEARLAEIFDLVNQQLKKIKKLAKLPGGAVITGGGAKLKGIADYAREVLSMNAHTGKPYGLGGVTERVNDPEFATVVGLMRMNFNSTPINIKKSSRLFSGVKSLFKKKK